MWHCVMFIFSSCCGYVTFRIIFITKCNVLINKLYIESNSLGSKPVVGKITIFKLLYLVVGNINMEQFIRVIL